MTESNLAWTWPKGSSWAGKAALQAPTLSCRPGLGSRAAGWQLTSSWAHFLRLLPSCVQSASHNEFSGKQIKGGVTSHSRQPYQCSAALAESCLHSGLRHTHITRSCCCCCCTGMCSVPSKYTVTINWSKRLNTVVCFLMGGREYGVPETYGYLFFPLCETTGKQNRGGVEGQAKETSVDVKAALLRSWKSGNSGPRSLLVGVGGGQWWAGGDRTGCLLGNSLQLGWDLSDWTPSPALSHSPCSGLGISLQAVLVGFITSCQVCIHQELPQETQFAPGPFPYVANSKYNKQGWVHCASWGYVRGQDQHRDGVSGLAGVTRCPEQRNWAGPHLCLCKTFSLPFSPH